MSNFLRVPIPFFFEGLPRSASKLEHSASVATAYVSDFLGSKDGLALAKAFRRISSPKLRDTIVQLVEQIAAGRL